MAIDFGGRIDEQFTQSGLEASALKNKQKTLAFQTVVLGLTSNEALSFLCFVRFEG